jgi:hypothetical protein
VIRRYGFVLEPVLWQIVIFAGGVAVGCGVTDADGHVPVPMTTTSPGCRRWAPTTFPELELGFVAARLETVIRRHGLLDDPVL